MQTYGNPPYFINDTVVYGCEAGFAPVALDLLTNKCEANATFAEWAIDEERLLAVCQPGIGCNYRLIVSN